MPSHFSTIGMPVATEQDMYELAEKASIDAEPVQCDCGSYYKWVSPEGAELWLHIDKEKNLVGLTPSFSGDSKISVGLTNAVVRPDDNPFEGAIYGWANPAENNVEQGDYPFVFDLVDKAVYGQLDFPFISDVTLSAFAHELTIYQSEQDYDENQTGEPRFAVESFIPSGLFNVEDDQESVPQPFANFTGRVLKAAKFVNPMTGSPYFWALVKTLGGTIDVLADPELVTKPLNAGGVVSGSFWLNGKIKNPKLKAKKGFLDKLIGR